MRTMPRRGVAGAVVATLMLIGGTAGSVIGATTVPTLWTAGGLSAGLESAGQAARVAVDAVGNLAIVSGPSGGRFLAVTSYTADGALRWQRTTSPSSGTFVGDWVAAAPNGDFVVIGHNQDSHGRAIASTMLRYDSNGTLLWRVDFSGGFFPSVARLLIDAAGNTFVASSATGTGFFVRKYSPSGALLWSQLDTIGGGYSIASSLALSPDETDVAVTGSISGGATWVTAVYSATTGVRRWQAAAAEGTAARDVVVDATRVYVTGQGVTGGGTPALAYYLTVVAYDRATGARLWRKDKKPADAYDGAGLWMAKAPGGSLVVAGQANRGFLDWYTVAFETTGAVRWEAVRDGGLNTDEIPRGLLVMTDGTAVVTGRGGPNLPGGYWPGVTAGYGPNGTLLWEAFAAMETVWATALPNGEDVCATGGYDALITCWRVSGAGGTTPTLSIGDVSVTEGNSGTRTASFPVTLSTAASSTVTVNYATANGTATAGSDYMAASGTLTFAAGTTTRTIAVTVNGDATGESNETFLVSLSAASGATIADAQGTGTIVNDDSVPTLSINDISVTEGNSGTKAATFTVTLSASSASPVSVTYATANGSATAGSDYATTGGSVTFPAGSTTETLSVTVNGDTTVELDETFTVNLTSPSGATLADAQGVATITNDDVVVGAQPVTWTTLTGVTASGNSLTDIAATGTNTGAASTQRITFGDGYVEFTASETTTNRLLGLSNGNTDASYADVDFGIALGSGGTIYVFEKGVNRGSFGAYQSGNLFRVAVVGGVVKYSRNGTLFYTSTQTRTYPLLVDTWLYTQGATLNNVVIQGQ